jgi:adenylate cyclase
LPQVPPSARLRALGAAEWVILCLCGVVGLGAALLVKAPNAAGDVLWRLELATYDWRLRMRSVRPPAADIVIVDVDTDSLLQLGQWPWPRSYHARLLDFLAKAGARVVVFDMVFDFPSLATEDARFAAALRRMGKVLLICEQAVELQGRGGMFIQAYQLRMPMPLFAAAARGVGMALVPEDVDGVIRRLKLWFVSRGADQRVIPFVGVLAAAEYQGTRPQQIWEAWKDRSFAQHPWMEGADLLIDYRAPPPLAYKYVPYHAVLKGQVKPEIFRGKIVLVGTSSELLGDLKLHPVGSPLNPSDPRQWLRTKMPGVEVLANCTDMLLEQRAIEPAPTWCLQAVPVLYAMLVGMLVHMLRIRGGLLGALLSMGVHWLLSCYAMIAVGVWLPVVAVWLGVLFAYLGAATLLWFWEERHTRWLRRAWERRVSPEILQLITANPQLHHIPGRSVHVTVMFIDLAGSTALSTTCPPHKLVSYLDEYLTLATEVIRRHGGTVHKFIGDGVLAVFGDPVPMADHAQRAVDAAFEFQERMGELRRSLVARGGPPLHARVGLHSGEVIAGDVGPPAMLEYTVIGETVNVAARMEALNKQLGSSICVSAETYKLVREPRGLVFAGAHQVHGMPAPVPVYADVGAGGGSEAAAAEVAQGSESK